MLQSNNSNSSSSNHNPVIISSIIVSSRSNNLNNRSSSSHTPLILCSNKPRIANNHNSSNNRHRSNNNRTSNRVSSSNSSNRSNHHHSSRTCQATPCSIPVATPCNSVRLGKEDLRSSNTHNYLAVVIQTRRCRQLTRGLWLRACSTPVCTISLEAGHILSSSRCTSNSSSRNSSWVSLLEVVLILVSSSILVNQCQTSRASSSNLSPHRGNRELDLARVRQLQEPRHSLEHQATSQTHLVVPWMLLQQSARGEGRGRTRSRKLEHQREPTTRKRRSLLPQREVTIKASTTSRRMKPSLRVDLCRR